MARAKRTDNKGRVLKVGESQNKDGRYCFKWTDCTGRRNTVYALDLAELRAKEKQIQRDMEDGIDSQSANMTLNQLFEMYLESKSNIRKSTRCCYLKQWNNNVKSSVIGEMKISQIKQIHIKRLYADLNRRGLEGSSIQVFHVLLSAVFQLAADSDMIRKNPCKNCRKDIKTNSCHRKALTVNEQKILLDFAKDSSIYNTYYPILMFALSTGLRVGELSGLTWDDVDLKNGVIHVRKQLVYLDYGEGYKLHVEPPKSKSGERDIPLTVNARKSLIQQKEIDLSSGRRAKERAVDGVKGFVFINSNGRAMLPINFNNMLKNITNAYNKKETVQAKEERREPVLLPHISAHILRHTFCTRMAEAGIDAKVL